MEVTKVKQSVSLPPDDTWNLGYLIFFWLGLGILMPFNTFITAIDYFADIYPGVHVDRIFSVAYMYSMLLFLVLLIAVERRSTSSTRGMTGFVLFAVLILAVPLMDIFGVEGSDSTGSHFRGTKTTLILTVGSLAFVGIADALAQGSTLAFVGELPAKYTQAVMGGTAASGITVSIIRSITKAILPLRQSAFLYFCVAFVCEVVCIAGFRVAQTLPIVKYYRYEGRGGGAASTPRERECEAGDGKGKFAAGHDRHSISSKRSIGGVIAKEGSPDVLLGVLPEESWLFCRSGEVGELSPHDEDSHCEGDNPVIEEAKRRIGISETRNFEGGDTVSPLLPTSRGGQPNLMRLPVSYWHVAWQIKNYMASVAWIYVVTLSIFPGFITEDIDSTFFGNWYPVLLITSYNLGDFVAKMFPLVYIVKNQLVVMQCTLWRGIFFPLFALCNFGPEIFRVEPYVMLLTLALGLSNGYLTALLMMTAPKQVEFHEAEAAGMLMVLSLVIGLAIGSAGGWAWLLVPSVCYSNACLLGTLVVWTAALSVFSAVMH